MLADYDAARIEGCSDDAALIALCRRMSALNRAIGALEVSGVCPRDPESFHQAQREWRRLAQQAGQMRAVTIAGVRARVGAMGPLVADILRGARDVDPAERRLVEALLGDLAPRREPTGQNASVIPLPRNRRTARQD
jgi:hypothetical protein